MEPGPYDDRAQEDEQNKDKELILQVERKWQDLHSAKVE
jgi:hypothetical protein